MLVLQVRLQGLEQGVVDLGVEYIGEERVVFKGGCQVVEWLFGVFCFCVFFSCWQFLGFWFLSKGVFQDQGYKFFVFVFGYRVVSLNMVLFKLEENGVVCQVVSVFQFFCGDLVCVFGCGCGIREEIFFLCRVNFVLGLVVRFVVGMFVDVEWFLGFWVFQSWGFRYCNFGGVFGSYLWGFFFCFEGWYQLGSFGSG